MAKATLVATHGLNAPQWWARAFAFCSRENLSAVSFAIALLCSLTDPIILSPVFFYYLVFLYVGYRLAPKELQWSKEVALCSVISISAVAAIPVSALIEGRNTPATAFNAGLTLILFPLLFIGNVQRIFYALIPVWYLQAAVMAWHWFAQGLSRAEGVATTNANAGSAFVLLGALFLLNHPRLKWLAVPLLLVVPFSGSRWTLIVGALLLTLLFLSGQVRWRWILVGILVGFTLLGATQWERLQEGSRGNGDFIAQGGQDTAYRLTAATPIVTPNILVPQGFIDSQLHNVPLRMSVETGLVSGLAWLGVGALVLWRRPWGGYGWWMMLAVCLLSVMYYHTWIAMTGAFWWLLVADLGRKSGVTNDR